MPRRDTPLSVEIPAPEADRPQWTQVSIVAAVGFVLGILWPRYTGTRIAPNPPSESGSPAAAPETAVASASAAPAPGVAATATPALTSSAGAPDPGVRVGQGIVFRCR